MTKVFFLLFLVSCNSSMKQLDASFDTPTDTPIDVSVIDTPVDVSVDSAPDAMIPTINSCNATITFVGNLIIIDFAFACSDPNFLVQLNMNMSGTPGSNVFGKISATVPCNSMPQVQVDSPLVQFNGIAASQTQSVSCSNTIIHR